MSFRSDKPDKAHKNPHNLHLKSEIKSSSAPSLDTDSRRITHGALTVCIGKQNAAACQFVNIRSSRIGVPAHTADPII